MSKLTNSTAETAVEGLYSNDLVFSIPYFQRAYKWSAQKINRFETDLTALLDDDITHFLGAIIVYGKPSDPSEPRCFEVIDGQQRLTTCYLALVALCKVFAQVGAIDEAVGLYQKYIAIGRRTRSITNAKLICCKEDTFEMNKVFEDLFSIQSLHEQLDGTLYIYKPMPVGNHDKKSGRMLSNFKLLCKYFASSYNTAENELQGEGINRLNNLYSKLVNNMSIVQIVVLDPTNGPKIFNSLNSQQEPITTGDLVRNEIFSRFAGRDDDDIKRLEEDIWRPFYNKFNQCDNPSWDKVFEQYFFPYVLIHDHTVKKTDAFNYLRDNWAKEEDPRIIIKNLEVYQDIYLDLVYGTSFSQCDPKVSNLISNFSRMEAPSVVYPFIMKLVHENGIDNVPVNDTVEIMSAIESFLVRRNVCGIEPTGLHALFKGLWDEMDGDITLMKLKLCMANHPTVSWPSTEIFAREFKTRNLYDVKVTPYILEEWNRELGGDIIKVNKQEIEHVLPSRPEENSQWWIDWTRQQHKECKDCIANLLPISRHLNGTIQNKDFEEKRESYLNDSAIKAPRDFARNYQNWTPKEFGERVDTLWNWASKRWPYEMTE